jgi:hypothetical protein
MLNGTGVKIFTGSSSDSDFATFSYWVTPALTGTSHPELAEIIARR